MSWTGTAVSGSESDTGFLPSGGNSGEVLSIDVDGRLVWMELPVPPESPVVLQEVSAFGVQPDKALVLGNVDTPLFEVACPAGSVATGKFVASIYASNGSNHQVRTALISYAIINKGGDVTADIREDNELFVSTMGNMSSTWNITPGATGAAVSVTANSTLVETIKTLRVVGFNTTLSRITPL
jgi:hypothetical protein